MGKIRKGKEETMTPNGDRPAVTRTVFDLDSFDEIELTKQYDFSPVTSAEEAVARLGNDTERFLRAVNAGLQAEIEADLKKDATGWSVVADDGRLTPYAGTQLDKKAVSNTVIVLAKNAFGYDNDGPLEQKRATKKLAQDFIRNNPEIRKGMARFAAAK